MEAPSRQRWTESLLVLLTAAVALAAALTVLGLWDADLHRPLDPTGDSMLHLMMVKAVAEEGWPLVTVERLGAPGTLDFRDFPALDPLNLLIVRGISWFTGSPGLLINLFYLLTFPLIAASAFLCGRRLGLSGPASFAAAVLYALLPYHFLRGTAHLFLSAYYLVPPAALLAWELAHGGEVFQRRRAIALAVLLCVLLGGTSPYYAYFAAIFLAVGGIAGSLGRRSWRPLLTAGGFVAVVVAVLLVQTAPALMKQRREGRLDVAVRYSGEAELYGLKITQLVLPITEHRWGVLRNLKRRYNSAPLVTENDLAGLGLFGTIGFVWLLAWLFFLRPRAPVLDQLSVLNGAGLLVGTIGGVSALFSLLVTPQIRSVNRISVFIAFFSLVAAGALFDRASRRWKRWAAAAVAFLVVVVGAADQTNRHMRPRHMADQAPLARYAAKIESSLPPGAAVFQLPYFVFPERGHIHWLGDYELFRPFLYTRALRFSYGAAAGSRADLWQQRVASQPPAEMARSLALAGFAGVMVDRSGYVDRAEPLERDLAAAAGAVPFVSEDGRLSFIRLVELRQRLARELGPRFEQESARAAKPLLVGFRDGFYGEERNEAERWRWSRHHGTIAIDNGLDAPREVLFTTGVAGSTSKPSLLRIRGPGWNETLRLGRAPVRLERRLTLDPGLNLVSIRSNGPATYANGDTRAFVFKLSDYSVEELPAAVPAAAQDGR